MASEGGFHVKVVDNNVGSNKSRKVECPICLMVFREPVQAIPCGHRFCESCLNKHKTKQDCNEFVCPLDRSTVQIFPDVGHKREILELDVECLNVGCTETGELRHFKGHLQKCPMQILECKWKCGIENILRKDMIDHLKYECPQIIIACKYSNIGCSFQGRRDALKTHLIERVDKHRYLQLSQKVKDLEHLMKTNTQQNDETAQQKQRQVIETLEEKVRNQDITIQHLQSKFKELIEVPVHQRCPYTFTIKNAYNMIKDENHHGDLCSDPFYFLNGYRGYLKVYLNGCDVHSRKHISVFFGIEQGPFDDFLAWPMVFGRITFRLLIDERCVKKMSFPYSTVPKDFFSRSNSKCRGLYKFCRHDEIQNITYNDEIKLIVYVTQ